MQLHLHACMEDDYLLASYRLMHAGFGLLYSIQSLFTVSFNAFPMGRPIFLSVSTEGLNFSQFCNLARQGRYGSYFAERNGTNSE